MKFWRATPNFWPLNPAIPTPPPGRYSCLSKISQGLRLLRYDVQDYACETPYVWLCLHQSPYPRSQLAVFQGRLILSSGSPDPAVRILALSLIMTMRFEIRLSGLRPQALR